MLVQWKFRCIAGGRSGGGFEGCGGGGERERRTWLQLLKSSRLPVVLNLERGSAIPEGLATPQIAGPIRRVTDSLGVGWGPRICALNKLPGAVAHWEPHFKLHRHGHYVLRGPQKAVPAPDSGAQNRMNQAFKERARTPTWVGTMT